VLQWRGNALIGEQGLRDTIVSLRRSLPDKDPEHPIIRTIPRQSYQVNVPVVQLEPDRSFFVTG
jgi:DNA-binding winged helix-turn-helix (wHTH) protein